jgi:type VI secretion system protein ImpE
VLAEPSTVIEKSLAALAALRAGDHADAVRLIAEAEEARPKASGTHGSQPFDDFRDLDDATAGVFEVLTSTGKYFWIPIERVQAIEFREPKRPRDLLWRQAEMSVSDGPEGEVYLPAIYIPSGQPLDDQLRLGRGTEWTEGDGQPTRGRGQRTFLVGDEAVPIMELTSLEFTAK